MWANLASGLLWPDPTFTSLHIPDRTSGLHPCSLAATYVYARHKEQSPEAAKPNGSNHQALQNVVQTNNLPGFMIGMSNQA